MRQTRTDVFVEALVDLAIFALFTPTIAVVLGSAFLIDCAEYVEKVADMFDYE